MGLAVLQVLSLVLQVCAAACSFVIKGSAGYNASSLPSTSSGIPVIGQGMPGSVTQWKPLRSNAPSPEFQPNGKHVHLPLPPLNSAPLPQTINGVVPSVSPTTSRVMSPYSSANSPTNSQGTAKSLPPSAPPRKPQQNGDPFLSPKAIVPVASPSRKSPQKSPIVHHIMPKSMPPISGQNKAPNIAVPLPAPIIPVQNARAPRKMPENPPPTHPIMPEAPSSVQPVPVASPMHKLPRISPSMNHMFPGEPSSKSPEPHFLPAPTPSTDWKRDGEPVAAPPHGKSHQISPVNSSPTNEPHFLPASTPSISWKRDSMPVAAPPHGKSHPISPVNSSPTKAPSMPKVRRHSSYAAPPLLPPKSPPDVQYHSRTPLPSTSFHRHHHAKENITSPAPSSFLVPPTASTEQGPSIHLAPSYPPKLDPNSKQRQNVASPPDPGSSASPSHSILHPSEGHISPTPSPSPKFPSGQITVPFLSPKTTPVSSPKSPKVALPPPIRALPPPPPNEDCAPLSCTEPLTNTPPGTPCGCVQPMQVGLQLNVALYTFFPLVSELAKEIAIGVFMKLSQVRIMGANAASQDPEKTIVLLNLVPLGERFDSTTAYLTYQRFWNKKLVIKASFFGDYEVLYVRYPGLPPSPPLPPSSINIIDGEPYSGHDNNGGTIKPLGVDVRRQQHKNGLNGSVTAVIVLSTSVAVFLSCAIVWIFLFKCRKHICHTEATPRTTLPSNAKSSGIPASITGSGPTSASLSFGSSMAYTGSAKAFSSSEIERATDNFNVSRILGEGGFGRVYSGVLEDGTNVAVKVLKRDDQQGGREFLAEVEMLSRLHHRNLVKLIGICTEDRTRCLVYELIPNGSVESHLHGVDKETAPLDWGSRMKIALGAARGLAYLHEDSSPRVIHRDFKSSNILLERDFTPKVSDFGLARTALDEENSHISTRVMGTFGYVAPEYAMTGHLLVKSDVYSYGVVLLELLTGRKPVDMSQPPGQENLVTWTRPLLTSKEGLESIVDPSLGPYFPFDNIAKVAAIASMCVQPEVSHRPFMGEVVQALKLVCNDSDKTKELGSRSCSREDLSVDNMDARISNTSDRLANPLQNQSPVSNYDYGIDVERGLPVSEVFSSSARYGRQGSGSFRRHSSSGPLGKGKGRRLWDRMRGRNGGSVSEHGFVFKLWPGSR